MADHDPKTLVAEDTRRSNVSKLVLLIMLGLLGIIVWFSNPTENAGTLFGEKEGKGKGGQDYASGGVIVPDPALRDYRITGAAAGKEPGTLRVTGKGPMGGKVQLWINGERGGELDVKEDGTWETSLAAFPTPPIQFAVGPREGQRAPEFVFTYEAPQAISMQTQDSAPAQSEAAPPTTETPNSAEPAGTEPEAALVISNPVDGGILQKGWEFTLRGTAPTGAEVEIMKDGQAVTVVKADAEGNWSHKTKADVGPHTYVVQVKGDPATKREVKVTVQ